MTIEELKKRIEKMGLGIDQASGQVLIEWEKIPFEEEDRPYWAGLSSINGIGPGRLPILIAGFGSAQNVFRAKMSDLFAVLPHFVASAIDQFRRQTDIPSWYETIRTCAPDIHLQFLVPLDKEFPPSLRSIAHGPTQLWVFGDTKILCRRLVAIVGTRKITPYGRDVTGMIARELVTAGFAIVSGLMYGVDEAAMRAALSVGGTTVGVWAGGITPASLGSRFRLAMDVVARGGAVVSEFSPGEFPSKGTFPARNRIVSGLSLGVVVTEGASRSGSLITAECGIEQGRLVFAVPGPVTSQLSEGPNELIKLGAQMVTSAKDILSSLGVSEYSDGSVKGSYTPKNDTERSMLITLKQRPASVDELVRATGVVISTVEETLVGLDMSGVVVQIGDEWKLR